MLSCIVFGCFLTSCAALEKDNEPKSPDEIKVEIKTQLDDVYRPKLKASMDGYGLARMNGSVGDSALFSCLALAAKAADFDVGLLFAPDGRPWRHPDIYSTATYDGKFTSISKDMVNGILLCLHVWGKRGHRDEARELVEGMIAYGRSHKENGLWVFCPPEDRKTYQITDERWYGRCTMTPAVSKDTYRVAIELGWECDSDCQITMQTGTNVPVNGKGFERHLAVLTTTRNGLVEGGINDNSLKIVLENAAKEEPRNALFQAAYHLFGDGDQSATWAALGDTSLFPTAELPTAANYCTHYLFERDEKTVKSFTVGDDGCVTYADAATKGPAMECGLTPGTTFDIFAYNDDWLPCGESGSEGRGIEWAIAAALALGEVE